MEQEALEQYQASDHNIQTVPSEETLAQRYQVSTTLYAKTVIKIPQNMYILLEL